MPYFWSSKRDMGANTKFHDALEKLQDIRSDTQRSMCEIDKSISKISRLYYDFKDINRDFVKQLCQKCYDNFQKDNPLQARSPSHKRRAKQADVNERNQKLLQDLTALLKENDNLNAVCLVNESSVDGDEQNEKASCSANINVERLESLQHVINKQVAEMEALHDKCAQSELKNEELNKDLKKEKENVDKLENNIRDMMQQKEDLNKQNERLQELIKREKDYTQELLDQTENEKQRLEMEEKRKKELQTDLESLKNETKRNNEKHEQLKAQLLQLSTAKNKLEDERKSFLTEITQWQTSNKRLKEEFDKEIRINEEHSKENNTLRRSSEIEVSRLETKIKDEEKKRKHSEEELAKLRLELKTKIDEITLTASRIKADHDLSEANLKKMKERNESLENELVKSKQVLLLKTEELSKEKLTLQQKCDLIECLNRNIKAMEECALKDKYERELQEMKTLRQRSKVLGILGVRSGVSPSTSSMLIRHLSKRLKERLSMENVDLAVNTCSSPHEVPDGPFVVLCMNISRVVADVQEALEGVPLSKKVIVIVLHHTAKDNLNSLTPTRHCISGGSFRNLGSVLDMAFQSKTGFFDCDINTETIEALVEILKTFSNK